MRVDSIYRFFFFLFFFSFFPFLSSTPLLVHVLPHSHCDPGWLETFEGYSGAVSQIIEGVIRELGKERTRTFVWAETSFFMKWYERQNREMKGKVKRLVENGQWEFVGGGWVQNDEANPSVFGIVNQMTVGHEYLLKNFGVQPKFGWQIDPFGHSSATPSMFALMGFEALVINRIHFAEKDHLKQKVEMEFLWRGANVGINTDMMTHVLHTHYSSPHTFDWEDGGIPISDQNVEERARTFCDEIKLRANTYRTRHVLLPFGDDFKFKNANIQFENMDRIFRHVNDHQDKYACSFKYSTLTDYFDALHEIKAQFPLYQSDFFPYADNGDSFWTGYYTTRPFLKTIARKVDAELRSAEIFLAFTRHMLSDSLELMNQLEICRQDAGLFLHHDAITGTARLAVNEDYMNRMNRASVNLRNILKVATTSLLKDAGGNLAEQSQDGKIQDVVITNSLGWIRKELVTVRVTSRFCHVTFRNESGNEIPIPSQVEIFQDSFELPSILHAISAQVQPDSKTEYLLSFVVEIPAVSVFICTIHSYGSQDELDHIPNSKASVFVSPELYYKGEAPLKEDLKKMLTNEKSMTFENDLISLSFSLEEGGFLRSIKHKDSNASLKLKNSLGFYKTQRSGAYIFRPENRAEAKTSANFFIRIFRGPIVSSLYSLFDDAAFHYKLVAGSDEELCAFVPTSYSAVTPVNHEMIVKFSSDLDNQNIFYTDNGLEWIPRQYIAQGPIAANYYPMVTAAKIHDATNHFSVLTSHSAGCSSQGLGELEFMIHRSTSADDGRGLGEGITDTTRVQFFMLINMRPMSPYNDLILKRMTTRLNHPIALFFGSNLQYATSSFKLFKNALPEHIHLFSLSPRDMLTDELAIRLQSISASKEALFSASLSDYVGASISTFREASLSLNYELEVDEFPLKRYKFLHEKGKSISFSEVDYNKVKSIGGASQNTDEDGVFLSDAAIKAKERQLKSVAKDTILVNPLGIRSFLFVAAFGGGRPVRIRSAVVTSNVQQMITRKSNLFAPAPAAVETIGVRKNSTHSLESRFLTQVESESNFIAHSSRVPFASITIQLFPSMEEVFVVMSSACFVLFFLVTIVFTPRSLFFVKQSHSLSL